MDTNENFTALFNHHYPKVLRICKGYFNGNEALAVDTTQEVFIKVWEKLPGFRQEASISTWIFRITVNTCLMQLRKTTTIKEVPLASIPDMQQEEDHQEQKEKLRKLYTCIQRLDETGKLIILLVLESVAYPDIAQIVGISEETLRVKIHRIKKNLTQCVLYGKI
ncbi:sigma-70 family RNA polymerase sigma factor [Chitinophaga sp. Mgbs1]|uniref:Sigma-70 family RNA polymerase sigma factor n=1 Tax=Chitinophaga solisilvae TaxID=1233460 RepID=A0A3S1B1N5_9BACT|nr:sigma-70 family RNA polymerase sigma factor [Chitinophaga solisilvae]